MPDDINIKLTHSQALVLFDWLSRDKNRECLEFIDPAEEQVLWILEGKLEQSLREPFADNYFELVAAARDRVRDNPDG